MYIETWQIFMMVFIAVSAYFSYRSGWKEGVQDGIHIVITDLARNTIISKYEDKESGEVTVGRYDADPAESKQRIDYE